MKQIISSGFISNNHEIVRKLNQQEIVDYLVFTFALIALCKHYPFSGFVHFLHLQLCLNTLVFVQWIQG